MTAYLSSLIRNYIIIIVSRKVQAVGKEAYIFFLRLDTCIHVKERRRAHLRSGFLIEAARVGGDCGLIIELSNTNKMRKCTRASQIFRGKPQVTNSLVVVVAAAAAGWYDRKARHNRFMCYVVCRCGKACCKAATVLPRSTGTRICFNLFPFIDNLFGCDDIRSSNFLYIYVFVIVYEKQGHTSSAIRQSEEKYCTYESLKRQELMWVYTRRVTCAQEFLFKFNIL